MEVNDQIWEKTVEKGTQPVAVMFYSPTCPFCQQIEPYFKSFAGEFRNSVLFTRINILANPWTAERYGIKSPPTFKFFCDGKAVQEIVGSVYPTLLK
ncbi:MAG: thioredoxin family protein [Methanomicrobiales archaeon]